MGNGSLHLRPSLRPRVRLQIPPLRFAPVGMDKGGFGLSIGICDMDGRGSVRHSGSIKGYFRDQDETDGSSALCLCQRDMQNAVLR
jgi:hypothetical protein